MEQFGTDEKCRALLETLRWPDGVECPRCQGKKVYRLQAWKRFECAACGNQFTLTAGTVLNDSHLSLAKWFLATYIICQSKKGVSALQLKRMLGVSYKTAWYLCHRIREAMTQANRAAEKLGGTVEVDDTFIGGKAERGRPIPEKVNVVGMVERDGRLRLQVVDDLSVASLKVAARKNIGNIDLIITDEWAAYVGAIGLEYKRRYKRIRHKATYVRHDAIHGKIHTNTIEGVFSLLKRGIIGSWHHVSVKHLQRYLDEISFRYSERENPRLFALTLSQLIETKPMTFKALTADDAA